MEKFKRKIKTFTTLKTLSFNFLRAISVDMGLIKIEL